MNSLMSESSSHQVCPHLRWNQQTGEQPLPHEQNRCLLASSIYLPRAQQTRYCLGGRYRSCSRFMRQGEHPIPSYVRGAVPPTVRPTTPTLNLRTMPWRHPWVPMALKWLLITLLVVAFVWLWQWRMAQTPPFIVEREQPPTPMATPTPAPPTQWLRPTAGPENW
jgi:hypothetical protein